MAAEIWESLKELYPWNANNDSKLLLGETAVQIMALFPQQYDGKNIIDVQLKI